MATEWPPLAYDSWSATCDTLHAHTQVLGKLAVQLAPPEPQLQHAALRLSARGWETLPLPAPDGSGAIVAALDLRTHEAVVEHSNGRETRIALTPHRPVAEVTREVLEAVGRLGGAVEINPAPQEVPWTVPLDEDYQHATYDADQVATYFEAATQAALVLAEFRAPFRGRSTPVNAWWGTFDLAVNFFSGRPADPPSDDFIMRNGGDAQQVQSAGGRGIRTTTRAAFFAIAYPAPDGFGDAGLSPAEVRWDASWASTCSTGRTSGRAPIPMPSHWNSRGRPSATPARCANGTRPSRPRRRVFRRRSGDVEIPGGSTVGRGLRERADLGSGLVTNRLGGVSRGQPSGERYAMHDPPTRCRGR